MRQTTKAWRSSQIKILLQQEQTFILVQLLCTWNTFFFFIPTFCLGMTSAAHIHAKCSVTISEGKKKKKTITQYC